MPQKTSIISGKVTSMYNWLDNHKDVFSTMASIATVVLLFFTFWQIKDTKNAVQGNIAYQVQKDGLAIFTDLSKDEEVYDYIINSSSSTSESIRNRADRSIHTIINFFASVFRLNKLSLLESSFWNSYQNELCGTLKLNPIREYWTKRIPSMNYDPDFKRLGESCLEGKL